MASAAEMFQFVSTFGPMLGELAARVEFLEQRIEQLEGGARAQLGAPAAAEAEAPAADESFEFMGQKIDLKSMLEGAIPGNGGMPSIMERLKNWTPPAAKAAGAPATNPAAAPAPETPKTT